MGWIKEFFISGRTSIGILPIACPNCHKPIELGNEVFSFGYYRHRKCHKLILEVRKRFRVGEPLDGDAKVSDEITPKLHTHPIAVLEKEG